MEEKEKKEERKIAINFENFTFKYESQSKPTLHNINLKIYEGEKIVIVGPSNRAPSPLSWVRQDRGKVRLGIV